MFLNVVLEKDTQGQLDRSCKKRRSITYSQEEQKHPADNKKRKATWIAHILCRNFNNVLQRTHKRREDNEDDISSYCVTFMK